MTTDIKELKSEIADLIKRLAESDRYTNETAKRNVVRAAVRMLGKLGDMVLSTQTAVKTEQPSLSDEKIANDAMLAAGFEVDYDKRRGVHTYTGFIEDAMKLLSAQRQDSDKAECKCSLRTKLVGDGCEVCNPKLAEELAQDSDKDAERYRWLKTIGWRHGVPNFADNEPVFRIEFESPTYGWNRGESDVDIAIDRAIANGAPK